MPEKTQNKVATQPRLRSYRLIFGAAGRVVVVAGLAVHKPQRPHSDGNPTFGGNGQAQMHVFGFSLPI